MAKTKGDVKQTLQKAADGLLYRTETDEPFEVVEWPGETGKPDKARVLELAGAASGASVKTKTLDTFFRDMTKEQDWHDETEKAEVQRFKDLVRALKESLTN